MTEDLEDEKKSLNKDTTEINRGVELLLRRRRKPEKPKTFQEYLKDSFRNLGNPSKTPRFSRIFLVPRRRRIFFLGGKCYSILPQDLV